MILQELCLNNFGLFRGKQRFELSPTGRNGTGKPIVLFGGMNGGGKTTIFDGLQLALYGSRARCSKRAGFSYEDFLRESINNNVSPETGAGVALSFSIATNGVLSEYHVRRDWQVVEGKIKESLIVNRNGFPDYSITRQWSQLIEELLPIEISQLFFFDAEKIRSLADDASSSETLGTAIKTLLGLDIVERLVADTSVLIARLTKQGGDPERRAEVEALERSQTKLQEEVSRLQVQRASLENERLRAETELHDAEEAFSLSGGRHVEERQTRRGRLVACEKLIGELEEQLVVLAGTDLPLQLVTYFLELAAEQDKLEQAAATANVMKSVLAERDRAILHKLESDTEVPKKYLRVIAEILMLDRESRTGTTGAGERLGLSPSGRSHLFHLLDHRLDGLRMESVKLTDRLANAVKEKEDLSRLLAATPEETDIGVVIERLKLANQVAARLNGQAKQLDAEIASRRAELGSLERRLKEHLESQLNEGFDKEDVTRMTERAAKTRTTMQEFLRRATERKIDRLSSTINESFRFLLRKQTLVERIMIDPSTFAVTLYDTAGSALPRHRLSEGEKQIFAISMLWGLARSSSRPLPAVIDTPMARLDATHRQHLIERYFPNASHQVVILSTDTEVDRKYYEMLKPKMARAYQLDYDEKDRMTEVREGYFWT